MIRSSTPLKTHMILCISFKTCRNLEGKCMAGDNLTMPLSVCPTLMLCGACPSRRGMHLLYAVVHWVSAMIKAVSGVLAWPGNMDMPVYF